MWKWVKDACARVNWWMATMWTALLMAWVGSLSHVAWAFSTLSNGDLLMGYIQAVGVDLGMAGLTVGLARWRAAKRNPTPLWIGIAFFSAISFYANMLHGQVFLSGLDLSGSWLWVSLARPFLLSAVLPIMVVYLIDVATQDLRQQPTVTDRSQVATPAPSPIVATTKPKGHKTTSDKGLRVLTVLQAQGGSMAIRALARAADVSPSVIYNLLETHQIARNGTGVILNH